MSAQPPDFDPLQFKETTREQWEQVAEAWHRWGPTLQDWLGPVTETMLELTHIGPGDRVLDVAAGAGEPALSAAARVGPTGYVLATDLSTNLLDFAALSARERGLGPTQFETRVMDGEHLVLDDAAFDVALSRLGLVYFPDRLGALTEMRRVLKPGGRAAIASFTTPDANRFFSIPIGIIRRRAQLPPPAAGLPGPFSLGRQEVMEETLRNAGFGDIQTRAIHTFLRLSSAAECVRFERESFGALQQMLVGLAEAEREAAWDEIERELRQFQGQAGFEAPAELIVGAGRK
jgi:ubiquinone/menaquinone biosynthesis C-methylase UbiE